MAKDPYFPLETLSGRYKFHVERTLIECRAILKDLEHALSNPANAEFHTRWRNDVEHFSNLARRCEELLPYLVKRKQRAENPQPQDTDLEGDENEDEASM
ncbi:hypothetical protein [Hyphomicrobium sp. DY-1]|uniref:hypothetical protein n=1 Tax=Hyphomicrobium sp. DY-1 TaxID=3075650 RepID=UPI0039C05F55